MIEFIANRVIEGTILPDGHRYDYNKAITYIKNNFTNSEEMINQLDTLLISKGYEGLVQKNKDRD